MAATTQNSPTTPSDLDLDEDFNQDSESQGKSRPDTKKDTSIPRQIADEEEAMDNNEEDDVPDGSTREDDKSS